MINFKYKPEIDDMLEFYNFIYRRQHIGTMLYVLALIWLIPVAYTAISSAQYVWLAVYVALVAAVLAVTMVSIRGGMKREVKKYAKADGTYLSETGLTVWEHTVELHTAAQESGTEITTIYPLEMLNNAYETPQYFFLLFYGGEPVVIPKESITEYSAAELSKKIGTMPTYKFIGKEKK